MPETLRPVVGSEAMARLYGAAKPSIPAKLRLLSDAADPQARTFEARYVLEGALASAPLGSTVTLNIAEDQLPEQVLQVPIAAIYGLGEKGRGYGVFRVSPSTCRGSLLRLLRWVMTRRG